MDVIKLKSLKETKPTQIWLQEVDEFYDKYNLELIENTNKFLDSFIDRLISYKSPLSKQTVKGEVKELVLLLNELNEIQPDYLATTEREDLCIFIDNCILASGIELEKHEDLTFEWREW